ncbi:LuxR family transcriptional regulator, quorum-sensing system regulator ExpR [Izhakiella capsodis]|uniref:LuxR family transcriptional regulator, quorum-sensing system regulator ExpR n=1 Tax=Izhakiella capsodis TaxID=1367852 RepID=A0A1I5A7I2_9GAMM|nr:helix-turn-helix transcriptional regulator [Izhakiella capsodis]SFN58394.1 LuxR family transcriptional regulator, quorum-sensing system regulator ExpR [Izhakiella capsodis]
MMPLDGYQEKIFLFLPGKMKCFIGRVKGKTYNEVSVILAIKERTVKFHMGNIVMKLNASNAKHAIKIAYDLNIVNLSVI